MECLWRRFYGREQRGGIGDRNRRRGMWGVRGIRRRKSRFGRVCDLEWVESGVIDDEIV